jgi:hypothetical protein
MTFVWRQMAIRVGAGAAVVGGLLTAASSITPFHGPFRPLVPIGVACLGVGVVGVHAAIGPRETVWRRTGWVLVGLGVGLGVIGMAGSALGIVGTPVARVINTGEHAGLPCIGAGMLAWGWACVRARAMGRWSVAPLLIGVLGLIGAVTLNRSALAFAERTAVLPALFGASWVGLGIGLLAAARRVPTVGDIAPS